MIELPTKEFSWTQYTTYSLCGLKYYWKYVKHIPTHKTEQMIRGTAFHAAAKISVLSRNVDEAIAAFDGRFEIETKAAQDEGAQFDTDVLDEMAQTGRNMIRAFHFSRGERLEISGPDAFEIELHWKLGDVPMVGYVDCVDIHHDVIDFKASSKKPSKPAWGQIILYADALEAIYKTDMRMLRFDYVVPYASKEEPAKYFYFKKQWATTKRSPHLNTIVYAARAIANGFFPPCPADSWICNHGACEYFDVCEFGKDRAIDVKIREGLTNGASSKKTNTKSKKQTRDRKPANVPSK